ncbi:MAG: amino acid dehydrogenase [Gammaproteobacteria bacterium]|nr:amino acid dehydrogenase [Gammaproteobacteria bacterium]MDE0366870.1 amino acid dehydrogenase [Gammaproteobacteria bacterium]
MHLFDNPAFDDHEAVHHVFDKTSGLRAIIAIHSTALGPAAGGCRRWHYGSEAEALNDVLRLSRGMSYKNALAGLPFGGGKCVVLCEPGETKSAEVFQALGAAVDSLGGRYITGEDVGVSTRDMAQVGTRTKFVSGLPHVNGAVGGDPSPWTALGVALGMEAAARRKLGAGSLEGLRVAVQGVGHVGFHLCRLLAERGARLVVSDLNADNLRRTVQQFGARAVPPEAILFQDVEILAPCALGAVLNARTIPGLKCRVVAGSANNQLETAPDAMRLHERGILFAPDYVINSGGVICIAREYLGGCTRQRLADEVHRIPQRLTAIFDESARTGRPASVVADEMAEMVLHSRSPADSSSSVQSGGMLNSAA